MNLFALFGVLVVRLEPFLRSLKEKLSGTGSYPLPPHGLHRQMRHTARMNPFMGPCFMRACLAYSEQVGVKRQAGGV